MSYSSHHYTEPVLMRQESMKLNYLFQCQCSACTNDFPLYAELRSIGIDTNIRQDDREQLKLANRKYALTNLSSFTKYLRANDHFYPCAQLHIVQQHFRECLHILAENYSIKFKY